MKIAVVADVLGEENNGTATACYNLIRYLQSRGDEVHIVCADQDKRGLPNYYVVGNIKFGPLLNKYLAKNNVTLARKDKKVLKEALKGVDIVHIMMPFSLGCTAVKVARRMHIPVTAGFHCQAENFTNHIGMMDMKFANYLTYKVFYHNLYRYVNGVHYPTEFIKETFESSISHHTPAYVISNGVANRFFKKEVERPDELKDKYVILFTGRYSKEKSHKVLIDAINKSKYKEKIQLIFAGQGPLKDKLVKRSIKRGINMPIMQFYSKDELVKVINYSDLYCHPAEIEIEAISCLEAISCGLVPVIANSRRCATKAFALDDKNLFKVNNPTDLAKKIDYWIENPEEKEKRSEEYLGYTKKFNQDECMKEMHRMMEECIKNYKK